MKKVTVGDDLKKTGSNQVDELSPPDGNLGISGSRRRFSRLGLGAAPIVISLVSKPVLGAQCLSNMLSGNLSDPNRGNCSKGSSPGGWGQPGGEINGLGDDDAWNRAGYNPEGTVANANLPTGLLQRSPGTRTLRVVLTTEGQLNRDRLFLCAWLNAKFSENSGGAFRYILTTEQVIALANNPLSFPQAYSDMNSFLSSTW